MRGKVWLTSKKKALESTKVLAATDAPVADGAADGAAEAEALVQEWNVEGDMPQPEDGDGDGDCQFAELDEELQEHGDMQMQAAAADAQRAVAFLQDQADHSS